MDALLPQALPPLVMLPLVVLPLPGVSRVVTGSRRVVERLLILGASALAARVIREIEAQPEPRCTIVGVVDDDAALHEPPFDVLGTGPLAQVDRIVRRVRPDRIIVALDERQGQWPVAVLLEARMAGIAIETVAEAYERLTGTLASECLTPSTVVFSKDFRPSPVTTAVARVFSFLIATIALVALAPVLGLIALAIRLDSPGPIFFRQDRVGFHGRRFTLVKFRTMRPVDRAPSEWERDNCDRITRLGKWLRRFRLDELPQLVNIIRGEMNLVGPRPHPVSNFRLFVEKIPHYSLRAVVRPGLTGWAQIRYRYANNLEEETEKVRYDLYYIKRQSLWVDLHILLDTVRFILRRPSPTVATPPSGHPARELDRAA